MAAIWTVACVGGFAFLCVLERRFIADDAWITARYARNLARGLDFAWNPDGVRVEGFSNPALVVLDALADRLGIAPVSAARAIGVASGIALLLVLHRRAPAVVGTTGARIGLALTALYPPLALWAMGGLETVPAALAMTTGVLLLCTAATPRDALLAGAAFAVLPWLRPEALVVALSVAALASAPGLLRRGGRREAAARLAAAAGPPIASQAVLVGVRLTVYGHVLPNPFFNKTRVGAGFQVLDRFIHEAGPLLIVASFGLVLARGRARLLAVPPLVYAVGSIGTADSVNFFSRYFLPTWPLCALLAGVALTAVTRPLGRVGPAAAWSGALGLLVAALFLLPGNARALRDWSDWYLNCREDVRRAAAVWLRSQTPPDARYSISDAGLVPLLADRRPAIDQLWLNEPILQRTGPTTAREHADYVLARRPAAVLLASGSPQRFEPLYRTDAALAADPRLRRYRLAAVARSRTMPGCHYALFAYRLRR